MQWVGEERCGKLSWGWSASGRQKVGGGMDMGCVKMVKTGVKQGCGISGFPNGIVKLKKEFSRYIGWGGKALAGSRTMGRAPNVPITM